MTKQHGFVVLSHGSLKLAIFTAVVFFNCAVFANPVVNNVASGNVTIEQTPTTTTVNQASQKAIINWQSFNIAAPESTHFQQPASGITLNRINPTQGASQIFGRLTATGRIILVNPAGIYFGPSAYVNVGGLIASTANISDEDFLHGYYHFTNVPGFNGAIVNQGQIIAADHGLIALIGGAVTNDGFVQAQLGQVVLASGEAFTMTFLGDDLVSFSVDKSLSQRAIDKNGNVLTDGVKNSGTITANGGHVLMKADAVSGVLDRAVNVEGLVKATSFHQDGGEIVFSAEPQSGVVRVAGTVDASGTNSGESGGKVTITGEKVLIDNNANINASGDLGGGTILIGGNARGEGPELNADYTVIAPNANIIADALSNGNGGKVVVWSNFGTQFYGNISARGGANGGDGGWVETSGKDYLFASGTVNASAPFGNAGEWLLDPRNVFIQNLASSGGTFNGGSPNVFTPTSDNAIADRNTIQASLNAGTSVTITTGASGTQNGDITVGDTITKSAGGNATLTLTANTATGGVINLNNPITSTVGALTVTLTGATINLGADVTTLGGNINFNNAVSLTAGTTLNLGAGNATFSSTLNGGNTLAINSSGTTTFTGTVGATTALTSLTTDAGGSTAINGGSVRTSGGQTYGDNVTLNANTTLSSTGSGNIVFNGTLNSLSATARTLAINTSGTTTFGGAVGTTFALSTLTTDAGGNTEINGGTVTTSAAGGQVYNDAITLNADTTLNASTGALNLANTVNSFDTTARSLTLNTTGTTTITGVVGGNNVLSTLTTNAGGGTTINSTAITTSGTQTYNDAVTLGTASKVLTSTGGAVTFGSTIAGAFGLTVSGNTGVTFGGAVATPTSLDVTGATNLNASVTTTGTQAYHSAVTLGANATLTTTNSSVTFDSTIDRDATARTLTISAGTGAITLSGNVGAGVNGALGTTTLNSTGTTTIGGTLAAANLITNAGGTTAINGATVTTTAAAGQVYNDAVTLNADTTLNAGTGLITLAGTVNSFDTTARSLDLNATGVTTITGVVGGSNVLSTLTTNAGGSTSIGSTAITTSGSQTYGDNAALVTASKVFTSTGGSIAFNGTLSGGVNLTLNGNTGVTFGGAVTTLVNLDVTGATNINAGISTTGTQSYHSAVTLGADTILATTNDAVVFDSSISRDGTARALTINAGTALITISGNVGSGGALGVVALNSTGATTLGGTLAADTFTSNAGGTAVINGGAITTTGAGGQVFNDAVTLGADTTFDAGTGLVTFASTLNSALATSHSATIDSTGTTTFTGIIGGTTALSSLTTNAGGTTALNSGTVTTSGANGIAFNDNVTINANTTLNAGAGAITFGGTLDSFNATARTLALNSTGTTTLSGAVGNTFQLSTLTTNAGGTTVIDGGSVKTSAGQTYNDAVNILVNPLTLTVATASTDISMANVLNNISQTLSFATTGAGTYRDISFSNNSALAVVPTLPSGLRNVTLNFGSANLVLPTLTLSGILNATVGGGFNMSQTGPLVIAGNTVLAAGTGDITLTDASNNFGNIAITSANNATLRDLNTINFGTTATSVTNNLTVTAGTTITDSGTISAGTLTTTTVGGMALDQPGHTISNFNATNTGSGGISLLNTGALTLTGISQTAGGTTVSITNTGTVYIPDGVTIGSGTSLAITATDLDMNTSGAIASGTTTSITQRIAGASIGLGDTAGTMTISGSELQRITATGLTLTNSTDGDIFVDNISSANSANISGTVTLAATTGTLGALSFLNNSSSFRALTASADTGISVGTNLATTVGALAFTVNTGTLSVADSTTASSATTLGITANDINLNSSGALTSTTTMSATQNLAGGSIGLGDTAGTMTISGSELQRMTGTGLTLTNSTDGAIFVDNISSANSGNISGTITLTATAGTLGAISFLNNASSFRTLIATSDAATSIGNNLSTTVGSLTLAVNTGTLSVADGATAFSATSMAATANDLNLNTTGALTSTTSIRIAQNVASGSIGLGDIAGTMSVSGSELQRMTGTSLSFTNGSNGAINVDNITAANTANISGAITLSAVTGTLGTIAFMNNDSSFRTLVATSDAGTTVGTNLATTVGALTFTVNAGSLAVADGATALGNTTLAVTANDLNLNTTGALTSNTTMTISENVASGSIGLGDTAGTMTISGAELQRITATGLTLTNGSNGNIIVDGITALNSANISGATTLAATNGTLGAISFVGSSVFSNALTLSSDTTVGVSDGVTMATNNAAITMTAADINLNTTGAINAGTSSISITPNSGNVGLGNAAAGMSISGSELQRIFAGTLTVNAGNNSNILVDGVTGANTANIAGTTFLNATTGTLGAASFQNASSTFTNGLTVNVDTNVSVDDGVTLGTTGTTLTILANDLNLNTSGAINSGSGETYIRANTGTLGIGLATGTMSISNIELQNITAGNLQLQGSTNVAITVDGVALADTNNISGTVTIGDAAITNTTLTFANNASTFKSLNAAGEDGITVNAPLTTTVGDMLLTANITGAGNANLNADLTAAGTLTISSPGTGIILGAPVVLTGNNVALNQAVNGAFDLTINPGAGSATLQGIMGGSTPLTSLNILGSAILNGGAITTTGIQSYNGATTLGANTSMSAGGDITFGSTLDSVGSMRNLTLNAGSSGNITFNGAVGNVLRLNSLAINNVNNVTNNALLNVTTYNQLAGNTTAFGASGLNATGLASVIASSATGTVVVGSLSLETATANLFGSVNGATGQAAIDQITLLNTITAGTHFFDGIDMYPSNPTPTPTPTPTPINPNLPGLSTQNILPNMYVDNTDYNNPLNSLISNEGFIFMQLNPGSTLQKYYVDNKGCVEMSTKVKVCGFNQTKNE